MTDYTMSTNAHHPRVKNVARLNDGTLVVNLGGTSYAHVAILTTDEEWRAIVREVDQQVAKMDARRTEKYCDNCAYTGQSLASLAEHYARAHDYMPAAAMEMAERQYPSAVEK
jgi:hypothetical protein